MMSRVWRWRKSPEEDLVFDVVRRFQARGCQVATEVLALLRAGLATGAHARWRTLHENSITALFISERGADVAGRFVAHECVQAYKFANGLKTHATRMAIRPLSARDLAQVKAAYDTAMAKYSVPGLKPDSFSTAYGWAAKALNNSRPNFADLETAVGFDHWRPRYGFASQPVHAGIRSITHSLALPKGSSVIHTGPSNLGLVEPGHSIALSLYQLTVTMLNLRPSIDGITVSRALGLLVDKVGVAFRDAHVGLANRIKLQRNRSTTNRKPATRSQPASM